MAGIGFELKKMLRHQTYLSELTAYIYAATVSSGPWLMSILCLAVLGLYHGSAANNFDLELFRSTVICTYAFTLIFVGIIQLVATRYLADRYYLKDIQTTLATFQSSMAFVLFSGTALSVTACFFLETSLLHKFCVVLLFLVVAMIWLCMIFLSAIKDYNSIFNAFAVGSMISLFAALLLGRFMGTEGYLLGYLSGQTVIMFWLLAKMLVEYPAAEIWEKDFVRVFKKYWDLALIGFIYNLAIWVDKFIFWVAPDSRQIISWYRTHDLYEAPIFFSYLTVVPALAMFLLKIETRFYEHYRSYHAKVIGRETLEAILQEKDLMIAMLKENLREVFIIQGAITVLCVAFAPDLVTMAKLNPLQAPLFRICLIGSFLNVLLSINIIVLFYFDQRRSVLAVTALFLFSNALFSFFTTRLGIQFYGYGYTYACLVALLLAFYQLHVKMTDLEFITFAQQPVG